MRKTRRTAEVWPGFLAISISLSIALAVAVAVSVSVSAMAQNAASIPSCDSVEGFHRLDFWLGNWRVEADGKVVGTNRIEKVQGGCALVEYWTDVDGGTGQSLFYYLPALDEWHQVWVTPYATVDGGVKQKKLIQYFEDGGVRFQGTIVRSDGETYLDRTTLRPLSEGRVSQHIQISTDGGETWSDGFDAVYVPIEPAELR